MIDIILEARGDHFHLPSGVFNHENFIEVLMLCFFWSMCEFVNSPKVAA